MKNMTCENAERFDSATEYLCPNIKNKLRLLSNTVKERICEIRLSVGAPLVATVDHTQMFLTQNGLSFLPSCLADYTVSATDIQQCFAGLCENSVHTHSDEIREGFIILKQGHRAGIAGTGVYKSGELAVFRNISSINIRIAKQIKNIALPYYHLATQGSLLIAGPPATGKTTMLRDVARLLSNMPKRVCLIDSRGEIAASLRGVPQNDVGFCTDVLSGVRKTEGIDIALRCLNPDFIIFDEIGSAEECEKVQHCFFAGVNVICSAHAGSIKELYQRENTKLLLQSSCIQNIIFLPELKKEPIIHKVNNGT